MPYDPYPEKFRQVRDYFASPERARRFEGLLSALDRFRSTPTIPAAGALLERFFEGHQVGDTNSLRRVTSTFADKRTALALVRSALADETLLAEIAGRSYPHPIGFDKLVLYDHTKDGPQRRFKLRLHIYWRTPQELNTELIHLHRFEMASSPITGELTNHLYRTTPPEDSESSDGSHDVGLPYFAFTGYERDPQGVLHKRCLGPRRLWSRGPRTFVPGQTYAQALRHAHFVETNAETGHTNGDVCSTLYVHGPGLTDSDGRKIPVLFSPTKDPDEIITPIENLKVPQLRASLTRYQALLSESLNFYDWLYAERYGRNLSVGMIAGYLLSETFKTSRTIEIWERHRAACEEVLSARSAKLAQLIHTSASAKGLPADNRETRYFQALLNKSHDHPQGPQAWLQLYGDLNVEFGRYLGALIGDYAKNPKLKVLKPIWDLQAAKLSGGAHYGRVWALLEAARRATPMIMARFGDRSLVALEKPGEGPTSEIDRSVERSVRALLAEHFPNTAVWGEELGANGETSTAVSRWLVDPIDGTRNYLQGNKNFAVSLAHQAKQGATFRTTDAVVALPAHNEIYWSEEHKGAFRIDQAGAERRLDLKDHGRRSLRGALIDLSIRGLGPAALPLEAALVERGAVRRATGCASLMLAMVSGSGNAGAIVTANEYDVAAGLLIAKEAGATTSCRNFERAHRMFTVYIAGETEHLHRELEALVSKAIASLK